MLESKGCATSEPFENEGFPWEVPLTYANLKRCFLTTKKVSLATVLFAHKELTLGYSEERAILQLSMQLNDAIISSCPSYAVYSLRHRQAFGLKPKKKEPDVAGSYKSLNLN